MGSKASREKKEYAKHALRPGSAPAAKAGGGGADQSPAAEWDPAADTELRANIAERAEDYVAFFLPRPEAVGSPYQRKLTDLLLEGPTTEKLVMCDVADFVPVDDVVPLVVLALARGMALRVVELDAAGLSGIGLRMLALGLPRSTSLEALSLRRNGIDGAAAMMLVRELRDLAQQNALPRSLRSVDLASNPVWCGRAEVDGELQAAIEHLRTAAQVVVVTDSAPDPPFLVEGAELTLGHFKHNTATVTVRSGEVVHLLQSEHDFTAKQDAERKVQLIAQLAEVLIAEQQKPLEQQDGAELLAKVYFCRKRGAKQLILVTLNYDTLMATDRDVLLLTEFLASERHASLGRLLGIVGKMARLCRFVHRQGMLLTRILSACIAFNRRTDELRYLELQSLRADSALTDPLRVQYKCEDPRVARGGNLTTSVDVYALGMFLFLVVCFTPEFSNAQLFKFATVASQAAADKMLVNGVAYYKRLFATRLGQMDSCKTMAPAVVEECAGALADLVARSMQTEYSTSSITAHRPSADEFSKELQEITTKFGS